MSYQIVLQKGWYGGGGLAAEEPNSPAKSTDASSRGLMVADSEAGSFKVDGDSVLDARSAHCEVSLQNLSV